MSKVIALALAFLTAAIVGAAPVSSLAGSTPIPGGAYQLKGLTGTLGSTLFNGKIRIKKMILRKATASELDLQPGQVGIVFSCIVSNGTKDQRVGYLGASLTDADGIVLNSYGGDPEESNYDLPPGGAARQSFRFTLPSGFKPVKLLFSEKANGPQPVFRITLSPSDLAFMNQ